MPKPAHSDLRILETAGDHLRRFGPDRFTIVGVADELGMSHANVYRHFPSKAGLLEAVTANWLKPIETGLREIADGPDPARDKLERMLIGLHRAYREKSQAEPAIFTVFAAATRENGGGARKHRSRIRIELRRVLEEILPGGAASAEEVNAALVLILDSTFRFLNPVCVGLDSQIPRETIAQRLERLLEMLLTALSSK